MYVVMYLLYDINTPAFIQLYVVYGTCRGSSSRQPQVGWYYSLSWLRGLALFLFLSLALYRVAGHKPQGPGQRHHKQFQSTRVKQPEAQGTLQYSTIRALYSHYLYYKKWS